MSMILSSVSVASYQADRNTLAHSTEAVAGTKQAFAETDHEAPHGDWEEWQDPETTFTEDSQDATAVSSTNNHRYVLNVTA